MFRPALPVGLAVMNLPPLPPDAPALPAGLASSLAGLPVLDVAAGLGLAGGRARLYRIVLQGLAEHHDVDVDLLQQALAAQRWDDAERVAHTLKGISAQAGGARVRLLAEAMQFAVARREPPEHLGALQASLRRELPALLRAVADQLRAP